MRGESHRYQKRINARSLDYTGLANAAPETDCIHVLLRDFLVHLKARTNSTLKDTMRAVILKASPEPFLYTQVTRQLPRTDFLIEGDVHPVFSDQPCKRQSSHEQLDSKDQKFWLNRFEQLREPRNSLRACPAHAR